jgi:hypothetical protein
MEEVNMPIRSETGKAKRLNQKIIDELRELVRSGVPWVQPGDPLPRGYCDLLALVTGLFYFTDFIRVTNPKRGAEQDRETQIFLWSELREDILKQHIKREPGNRPWAWWYLEDRESRRVVEIDENMLACNEGRVYESQHDYLERLGLLTKEKKATTR